MEMQRAFSAQKRSLKKEKSRKTLYFTAFGVPGAARTRGLSLRRKH
jgi:hypothetical protein